MKVMARHSPRFGSRSIPPFAGMTTFLAEADYFDAQALLTVIVVIVVVIIVDIVIVVIVFLDLVFLERRI